MAQFGLERSVRDAEVVGSSPTPPTYKPYAKKGAYILCG